MRHLINNINMGYLTHSKEIAVVFKKKYICILEKLLKFNIISKFTITNYQIKVELRYFMNKPMFFFLQKSKPGNKIYYKTLNYKYKKQENHSILTLFSTSCGILTKEEILYKNMSGEYLCEIFHLKNNFN